MARFFALIFLVVIALTSKKSFVYSAALPQTHSDQEGNIGPQLTEGHNPSQDAEVQELEKLKKPANEGHSLQMSKSQSTLITEENGKHNERHDLREYIDENGKLIAKLHREAQSSSSADEKPRHRVRTELDIPSEGIHQVAEHDSASEGQKEVVKSFPGAARLMQPTGEAASQPILPIQSQEVTENGNRRGYTSDIAQEENNNVDHLSSYTGVQYSPLDMAEYIFWTGDEKGVTLAIEEFLQDGLMSREEAIAFLQEIKYNIEYLQQHYAQQRLKSAEQRMQQDTQLQEIQMQLEKNQNNYRQYEINDRPSVMSPIGKFNHDKILKVLSSTNYERNNNLVPSNLPQLPFTIPELRQDIYKKSVQDNLIQNGYKYNTMSSEQYEHEPQPAITEEDYEELLERLRVADFLYTEYSLEEVIYQLAKVMFTQSLSRGSSEAQMALQKFTSFLESEAEQGRISRQLEKKVLDVLIESLTDTLNEHPELISAARAGLGGGATLPPGNKALQQMLEQGQGPMENAMMKSGISGAYKAEQNQNSQSAFNQQPSWTKSREHAVGENQSKMVPMQPIKHFKMSA